MIKQLWAKTWPLLLVLAVALLGLWRLRVLATNARMDGTTEDYQQALVWAKDLLGVAATLAGFLGISNATLNWNSALKPEQQAVYASGGLVGILAGITLLEAGGWPIPAALAAMAIGTVVIRVRQNW